MALHAKNVACRAFIDECNTELDDIKELLKKKSSFDKEVPFLTRYAIIRSAGTIELAYKSIIADYCEIGTNLQTKNFLGINFRRRPINLKYQMICKNLKQFDNAWSINFKNNLRFLKTGSKWKSSLDSLIELRNDFAHGGKPSASFKDVNLYFKHAHRVMLVLERSIL